MCERVLVYGDAEERAAARDLEANARCMTGNDGGSNLDDALKMRFQCGLQWKEQMSSIQEISMSKIELSQMG